MSERVDQQLQSIFNNVNDWLKFAEAKNAALVAADVAILIGLATLLTEDLNSWLEIYLILVAIFADHDVESYLELLKKVMEEDKNPSLIGKAYVEQIIANSKIAVKKYGYFTTALFLLMTALITVLGAVLLLAIAALLNRE